MLYETPFFSVIIATYNSASTINACLQSILAQQYGNFEVVIQDGNSADNTVLRLQQFNDPRIKIHTEPDKGIYDAMNKAVKRATGQWLFFLGSDDTLYSAGILLQIQETIAAHPASRFVYGDVFTSEKYIQHYNNYNYLQLLQVNICHQAIFYHRSLFEKTQYDDRYQVFGDWDFNLRSYRNYNHPVYTGIPISNFNLGGKSSQWYNHPEFIQYFADKKALALRYRGTFFFLYYYLELLAGSIKSAAASLIK